jgi:hypothetical protein
MTIHFLDRIEERGYYRHKEDRPKRGFRALSSLGEAIDGLHIHFEGDKPVCNFQSIRGIVVEIPPCGNEVWFTRGELKIDPNYVTSDRLLKAGEFLRQKFCKGIAF